MITCPMFVVLAIVRQPRFTEHTVVGEYPVVLVNVIGFANPLLGETRLFYADVVYPANWHSFFV